MTSEPRAQFGSRQTGGLTALLFATRSGCLRCAVSLVKAGADVNKPNPDGVTPLINALDNGRHDIAMFLLDKGANPHVWDMQRPHAHLCRRGQEVRSRWRRWLRWRSRWPGGGRGGPPGGPGGPGGPAGRAQALPVARRRCRSARIGHGTDVINRLLALGVDTNHELTRKRPYGGGRGRFEDYDMRGGVGPLFVATMSNDHESMQALLAHGAEVDLPNVMQMTPLMMAAGMSGTGRGRGGGGRLAPGGDVQARAIKTIDLLLDAGANINAQVTGSRTHTGKLMAYVAGRDQEGRTALFAAAEGGRDQVVKHLLERGADPVVPRRRRQDRPRLRAHASTGHDTCGSTASGRSSNRGKPRGDRGDTRSGDGRETWSRCRGNARQIALAADPWSARGGRWQSFRPVTRSNPDPYGRFAQGMQEARLLCHLQQRGGVFRADSGADPNGCLDRLRRTLLREAQVLDEAAIAQRQPRDAGVPAELRHEAERNACGGVGLRTRGKGAGTIVRRGIAEKPEHRTMRIEQPLLHFQQLVGPLRTDAPNMQHAILLGSQAATGERYGVRSPRRESTADDES